MVVRIRFAMHGTRHNKFFHIVAINGKQRRDAKPIETLGVYRHRLDLAKEQTSKSVEWSVARIKYWLDVGAQPSKTAVKLFTQGGILPPNSKFHVQKAVSDVQTKAAQVPKAVGKAGKPSIPTAKNAGPSKPKPAKAAASPAKSPKPSR